MNLLVLPDRKRLGLVSLPFTEYQHKLAGVLSGTVVNCLTRNSGVLGSRRTRSSGCFRWTVLERDASLVKPADERHE